MISILKKLEEMTDSDLYALCEAVDLEIQRREAEIEANFPDSARSRAVKRMRSYRRTTGSVAQPVRNVGMGRPRREAA